MAQETTYKECSSCGSRTVDESACCIYCGTKREELTHAVDTSLEDILLALAESDSPEFTRKQLQKEISFLEEQYRDTKHPSILSKLEIANKKLLELNN